MKESGFFSFSVEMSVKRDDLGKDARTLPGTRRNPQAPLGQSPGAACDAGTTAPSEQKAQVLLLRRDRPLTPPARASTIALDRRLRSADQRAPVSPRPPSTGTLKTRVPARDACSRGEGWGYNSAHFT